MRAKNRKIGDISLFLRLARFAQAGAQRSRIQSLILAAIERRSSSNRVSSRESEGETFGGRESACDVDGRAKQTNGKKKKALGVVEKEKRSICRIPLPLSRAATRTNFAKNARATERARRKLSKGDTRRTKKASTRTWSPREAEQKKKQNASSRSRLRRMLLLLLLMRPLLLLLLPQQARRRLSTSPAASEAAARGASCFLFGEPTSQGEKVELE